MPEQSIVISMDPTVFAAGVVGVMAMCGLALGAAFGLIRGRLTAKSVPSGRH